MNLSGLKRNVKNIARNYTEAQVKVREATSNDPWGPPSSLMAEISDLTYNVVAFSEIMQMVWKRLNDHGKNYRHVYKALVLLDYLVKTGNEKIAQQCRENIFAIQTLRDFQHYEEGKDQGINVREKAKQLEALLKDEERLKNERAKALKARERFAQQTIGFGAALEANDQLSPSGHDASRSESFGSDPAIRSRPVASAAAAGSDMDLARPQTAGEEELQLQLALAMSREEAEKEEERRRSDDVRLALAMAQSQEGGAVEPAAAADKKQQSHLLDLIDVGVVSSPVSDWVDPWGTPAHPSEPPAPAMPPRPKAKVDFMTPATQTDAWGMPAAAPTPALVADPWSSPVPAATTMAQLVADPWAPAKVADPWSPQPPLRTAASSNDPWSPASAALASSSSGAGFDLLSSASSTQSPPSNSTNGSLDDPFDLSGMDGALGSASTGAKPKKSAENFLGLNSGLVNLDNLVSMKPTVAPAPMMVNPFAAGAGQAANPFQPAAAPKMSINEMRHQQNFTVPMAGSQPVPSSQPLGAWGMAPMTPAAAPATATPATMPLMSGMTMPTGPSVATSPTFNPFLV